MEHRVKKGKILRMEASDILKNRGESETDIV